jgi:hypothetical protein
VEKQYCASRILIPLQVDFHVKKIILWYTEVQFTSCLSIGGVWGGKGHEDIFHITQNWLQMKRPGKGKSGPEEPGGSPLSQIGPQRCHGHLLALMWCSCSLFFSYNFPRHMFTESFIPPIQVESMSMIDLHLKY